SATEQVYTRRRNAYDRGLRPINGDGAAQDCRIFAESSFPKPLANHGYGRSAGLIFIIIKYPAGNGIEAEHAHHPCGNAITTDLFRLARSGYSKSCVAEGGDFLERVRLLLPRKIIQGGSAVVGQV